MEPKNDQDLTAEEKAAKEYEDGWAESEKNEPGPKTETAAEKTEEEKEAERQAAEEAEAEAERKKKTEAFSKDHGPISSVEQALLDTKAALTKAQQENAELKRLQAEKEAGNATQQQVDAQKKATDDATAKIQGLIDSVADDYPELKPVFETLVETTKALTEQVTSLKKTTVESEEVRQQREALNHFNTNIKPEVLKEHPDYDAILGINGDGTIDRAKMGEYVEWAKSQRPSLRTAALDSGDPEDIKMAVREFKKFKGSPQAQAVKDQRDQRKKDILTDAQSLRGGASGFPESQADRQDPDNYDQGWDAAGKKLEAQGVK